MSDEVWRREEVQSPCIKVCVVKPEAGICIGCHRTVDEIARWSRMTPDQRRAVMDDLPGRAGRLTRRSGGRNGRLSRRARTDGYDG